MHGSNHGVKMSRGPTTAGNTAVVLTCDPLGQFDFLVLLLPSFVHSRGSLLGAKFALILDLFELQMSSFHLQIL